MTLPQQAIEHAHMRALSARQDVAVADDPSMPQPQSDGRSGPPPHEKLQKAVSLYYESLRSYLISQPEGMRYYTGVTPESPDDQGYGVLQRWVREESVSTDRLPEPPEDSEVLTDEQFYETAVEELIRDNELVLRPVSIESSDDGRAVRVRIVEHKTGLHHLDHLYDQREEVEPEEPTGFMTGQGGRGLMGNDDNPEPEMRVVLQPLELLMSAARELDRAASELDLLASTKESDLKPYMRDFDMSNGEAAGEVARAEVSGSPDM